MLGNFNNMLEARGFVKELDSARKILKEKEADYKGEYLIRDIIYKSKDPNLSLTDVFLRLRMVPVNIWEDKEFIVAVKKTDLKEIGKNSIIPTKEQFDTEEEARNFINNNLLDKFEYDYEFERKGWQYFIGEEGVDLEEVEGGHYTIEVKSETEEGLKKLVDMFNIEDVIVCPSVVAVKEILSK